MIHLWEREGDKKQKELTIYSTLFILVDFNYRHSFDVYCDFILINRTFDL
jgi:hypothetical protein